MPLTRADLVALSRKYREMAELRRLEYEFASGDPAVLLRRLSREFPGSLRELDSLSLQEIERRVELLDNACRGGPREDWVEWMAAYHELMRAALSVKRHLPGRGRRAAEVALGRLGESEARAIAVAVFHEHGTRIGVAFVHAVARPPRGRLNGLVCELLSARFQTKPEILWAALFPDQRAGQLG